MDRAWGKLVGWRKENISRVEAIELIRQYWDLGDEEGGYWRGRGGLADEAVWIAATASE